MFLNITSDSNPAFILFESEIHIFIITNDNVENLQIVSCLQKWDQVFLCDSLGDGYNL
jgi:hypothetical protein